ncbi:thioredoxin family protein [Mesorhizobium mediterraneum]|uniref:Thioredoxin family protein n=1 Tax=Mesorhizobium mediterraneum TaxID=43617 RepID=A0AB36RGP7_9HYPH|nr:MULTISPECIES: thioredoxin family protein [Mesorhizobium]PAQ04047.1 thioredoxin family protein [Mesorhizobium mediterraneum]RWN31606.1 MAG: thioredoxin family protein [Mesorhizobium sp.]RWO94914.1 MAG: thioredoxin family protein [Mesorhizobium sp.]WIW50697.1 thioredoxin family protein [Mesorhizobium mediterraneum]
MPKTNSNPIDLGTSAADFLLPDANGALHRLADFDAKPALLVAFISNRCPFVVLIREALAAFANDYADKGLQVVAINANDHEAHPEETLARIGEEAEKFGYGFPYLKDASQQTAKAYGAACTPDFFLFAADRRLAYHGQFDDARPGNGRPVTGADLRTAVDAVLKGETPAADQVPSIGCNIKWSAGNEPVWFSRVA